MITSAEVAIVGGGPAGAATAIALARAGRDVVILERAVFPRDKPCGDCANPGSLGELRRLGVARRLGSALSPYELRGWYVEAPDGSSLRAGFGRRRDGREARGWAVRRRDLDAALLAEARVAGARVEFGFRAFDLSIEGGRVVGIIGRKGTRERRITAEWIVGADGLRSVVRRRLDATRRRPVLCKIALVGHIEGEAGEASGYGELRARGGMICGFAPLRDGASVTLVIPAREAVRIRGDARAFLLSRLRVFPEILAHIRAGALEGRVMVTGPFDESVRRLWMPGAVLVGDAAGYFDPFTGQGIHQALQGARHAAHAIDSALDRPGVGPGPGARAARRALRTYERRVRFQKAATEALQRVVEAVISRPQLMSRCLMMLSRGDGLGARRLLRATGDLAHPVTMLDPLLLLRLLIGGR